MGESYELILEEHEQYPCNYDEAINDMNLGRWQDAMKAEMESIYSNQVWKLVDLLANIKPIGCKWVYKRKKEHDGRVETFKARLVAKGYTQREASIIRRLFLPVSMLKSIRVLLFIASHLDYEI